MDSKNKIWTENRNRSTPKRINSNRATDEQKKIYLASAMRKRSPQYIKA